MTTSLDHGSPRGPEDLTGTWLAPLLARSGLIPTGARVEVVSVDLVGTGQMADTVRVAYRTEGGDPAGTVIAKFPSADEQSRSTGLLTRAYEIEVGFYGHVAGAIGSRVPVCYHRHFDPDSGWFVLVLEDVVGGVQGEQLEGCRPEVAEAALIELAALHGPAWSDPRLAGLEFLQRGGPDADEFLASLVTSLWAGFVERYEDRLAPDHLALCDRFIRVLGPWLAARPEGTTVTHGDFRLDNLLFRPGEVRPYVVDWQTAAWGSAAADASYFLGGNLTVEDRRRYGDDLLGAYHDALMARGVEGYPLQQLHRDYRSACFGSLVMTIGASMLVKRTERGDDMFTTSATRYAQQVADLEAEATLPGGSGG